jgi:hypothetical protein
MAMNVSVCNAFRRTLASVLVVPQQLLAPDAKPATARADDQDG